MSRMLFTPADTTATSVVDSSVRSALVSKDCCAPRWTPPSPPVTKTLIPAREASRMVAATVVDPVRPAVAASHADAVNAAEAKDDATKEKK